jgi:hypothetical protein
MICSVPWWIGYPASVRLARSLAVLACKRARVLSLRRITPSVAARPATSCGSSDELKMLGKAEINV